MYIFSPFKWNVRAVLQPPIKLPWVCVDTRFFLLSKASFHFNAINFSNALHLPLQSAHILRRCLEKADAHEAITAQREMSTRSLKWKKTWKIQASFCSWKQSIFDRLYRSCCSHQQSACAKIKSREKFVKGWDLHKKMDKKTKQNETKRDKCKQMWLVCVFISCRSIG